MQGNDGREAIRRHRKITDTRTIHVLGWLLLIYLVVAQAVTAPD